MDITPKSTLISSDLEKGATNHIPFISKLFPDKEPWEEIGPLFAKSKSHLSTVSKLFLNSAE